MYSKEALTIGLFADFAGSRKWTGKEVTNGSSSWFDGSRERNGPRNLLAIVLDGSWRESRPCHEDVQCMRYGQEFWCSSLAAMGA